VDRLQEVMPFDDFVRFVGDGEGIVPDNHTFVPMVTLAKPFYVVWCIPNDVIKEMKERI
jgi:hypothetical protein